MSPAILKESLSSTNEIADHIKPAETITLRNRTVFKQDYTTKYNHRTFSYYFQTLIKNFKYFELDPNLFKKKIENNVNKKFLVFVNPNLNVSYNSFNYTKTYHRKLKLLKSRKNLKT